MNVINLPSEDEPPGPLVLDHIYVTEGTSVQIVEDATNPSPAGEKNWDKLALSGLSLTALAAMRTTPIGLFESPLVS